jgi:hypothetical protein
MKMERQEARSAIISEVEAALAGNDYLTVTRIYARLSRKHLDDVIADAMTKALKNASDAELVLAAQFAERSAEIREETEARMA